MPDNNTALKVLVLEDEPVISKVISRTLKSIGMETDVADNGLIAREKIDSGADPDLFIFDIRTPVINGIQLYEYMEKKYPDLSKKVIFMTGDYLNAVTLAFLDRVKRPFIHKPFTPDQILDLIRKSLNQELKPV